METLLHVFFIFCMTIEANTLQHLDHVLRFEKDNPGISRGLNIQICGSLHFFQKYYNLFYICLAIEANTVKRLAQLRGLNKVIQGLAGD